MITVAEEKKYIEGGAENCPKCGAEEIEATAPVEPNTGTQLNQEITCLKCALVWTERYVLISID